MIDVNTVKKEPKMAGKEKSDRDILAEKQMAKLKYKQENPGQYASKGSFNDLGLGGLIAKWMGKRGDTSKGVKEPAPDTSNEKTNTQEYTLDNPGARNKGFSTEEGTFRSEGHYNREQDLNTGSSEEVAPNFYTDEFMDARDFGMNFNPRDKDSVMEMQNKLNNAGIVGENGKPLATDGVLGPQTMHALRTMQSGMVHEKEYATQLYAHTKASENAAMNMKVVNDMIKRDTDTIKGKVQWGEYFQGKQGYVPDIGVKSTKETVGDVTGKIVAKGGDFLSQMREYMNKDKNA